MNIMQLTAALNAGWPCQEIGWILGGSYEELEWPEGATVPKPTLAEIEQKWAEMNA